MVIPKDKNKIIEMREDLSHFVVHLTRDDRKDNEGSTARRNFEEILSDKKIIAFNPHCIFNKQLKEIPEKIRNEFDVSCFTEIPLHQIHLLIQPMKGRTIKLEPYGFVFRKDYLISKGAQPAIYINSYDNNNQLRDSIDDLLSLAKERKFKDKFHNLFPFINAMHERYDFTWEREWRMLGDLKFQLKDIICVILPADKENELKERFAKFGIAVISPSWTYEQIIGKLAQQQRTTRIIWRRKKIKSSAKKKKSAKQWN